MSRNDEDALENLFADARESAPVPSADLTARVLADAQDVLAVPVPPTSPVWQSALESIGGWFGVGGLAAATLAGLYIGFADPTLLSVTDTVAIVDDTDGLGDFLLGDSLFFEEG